MRMDGGLWVPGALAPGTPASGNVLYPKSDGMWYTKDSAGVEVLVGSKNVPTPTIGTDSTNKTYVDAQIAAVPTMGQEMAYAERITNFATTSTTPVAVTSLSVTVTGTGRPVEIEFYCPSLTNSVANNFSFGFIYQTISGTPTGIMTASAYAANAGNGGLLSCKRRMVLTAATSYTFAAYVATFGSGTATVSGGSGYISYISVTQR